MRALKFVGIVLGGLIVLIAVLLLAVRSYVDPNDYKDRIAQAVRDSTGRELTLAGPIKLAVFPWIAIELGPASLGNPPGFGAEPLAAVQRVVFRVKVLPLLRKQLQIGRIEIDGLDLRLQKNAAGKGNWQDFGGRGIAAEPATSSRPGAQTLPDLAGVEIKDSRLSYQEMSADHVNLELGRVTSDTPVPVKLKLDLTTSRGAQPIELAARLDATLDTAKKQYRVSPVEIDGTLKPAAGAARVSWRFSAPQLSLDLAAQTFSMPTFTAQLASAQLTGRLQGSKISAAPTFNGSFKLDPVMLRELMGKLGIALPETRDAKVLAKLAARGDFIYGANALSASDLDIQLDDSRLSGKVALTNLDTKATSFDLAIDRLDIDRYRSPAETAPQPAAKAAEPATDSFKALDMNGTLSIGSATVASVNLTQVLVTVAAKDAVTHIAPATAKLYGGDYSGDITLDDRGAIATLKLDQSMTGIDVARLLEDLTKSRRISGRGTVTTDLTAHGLGGDALMKSLNGHIAANVDSGAIEGLDLWFEINRAVALIHKQTMPGGQSSGRTKFDTFKASADLTNGLASSKDLNIASQNLRVTGQGIANLSTGAIDYHMQATILKEAPGTATATGKTLADIPLTITGTLTSPKVRPDLEELAKARVRQELDKRKGELQQKLMDKLQGLFK